MTSNDDYVLEVLQESGLVTEDSINEARQSESAERMSCVDVLIDNQVVSESEVLATLCTHLGLEMHNLHGHELDQEVIELIPSDIVRRYKMVPLFKTDDGITVAMSDPLDFDSLDNLRHILKVHVDGVVSTRGEIRNLLERYYQGAEDLDYDGLMDDAGEDVDVMVEGGDDVLSERSSESDAPIIKLVNLIIFQAFSNRASDIHLEPLEKRFRVRFRIDGVLHESDSPPKRLQSAIVSRVKLMAGIKISEKRIPQDGRIQINVKGRELDLRVSTVPTNHGESIVMRILDKQNLALGLPNLGFLSDDEKTFERLISMPDGILLVTGPTGSGKTTTLYACLSHINKPDRKIITVEDPVEYQLSGVNQVQVRADIGFTFSGALRSILRQAPNIVMIGEIRDVTTANIATEASLTGHLVFSTLHTNDAPSAITRLMDIGVKPFLVASSLRAVIAQRLVRAICEDCKEEYDVNDADLRSLGEQADMLSSRKLFRGRGCNRCSLTGFKGRKGIFEIFLIDDEIQHMIFDKVGSGTLRAKAREMGMRTLREDGLRKVVSGMTTLEEIFRVTMGDKE